MPARFAALCFLLVAPSALAQGVMAFENPAHDFGTLAEGDDATHAFAFVNAGTDTLRVREVETTCGCTVPTFSSRPLAPGDSGSVEVAYQTVGRVGVIDRVVRVVAVGAEPVLLRLQGIVEPDRIVGGERQGNLRFDRVRRDLGGVLAGQATRHTVRLVNESDRPIKLLALSTTPEAGVETTFTERPAFPGKVVSFDVLLDTSALPSPFTVDLVLDTDDEAGSQKTVTLTGRRIGTN
jgi:hypothetical protein